MPFLELSFRVGDTTLLTTGFGQAQPLIADWRPAFREMYRAYAMYQEEVFATEGRAGLGKWKPLSPQYKNWKERNFPGKPILTRTGRMRAAAKTLVVITPQRLVMGPGSMVPYAVFHELGTRSMPRRPFVRPSRRFLTELREIARQHIVAARRRMKELMDRRGALPPRRRPRG